MTEDSLLESKSRTQSRSDEPGSWGGSLLSNLLFVMSLGVAAWVFLPRLGISLSVPNLQSDSQYRLTASEIEITPPPRWVPQDLVEQVVRQAKLPSELSLLEPDLSQRLGVAFEQHPWIKRCVRVQTAVPARIQVSLEYRQPVAVVRTNSGMFPVDADSVLLPSADFAPASVAKLPMIDGVQSKPRGQAGDSWGDLGVLGATQLANLLQPHWAEFGFRSIHVTAPAGGQLAKDRRLAWDQLRYRISTPGGSQVIWGRPPGSRHPGELTTDKKLGRIEFYLRHHGSFDSSHGPSEYDLTRWKDISRKPLADRNAERRKH